jgi:hypothetical protein
MYCLKIFWEYYFKFNIFNRGPHREVRRTADILIADSDKAFVLI